MSNGYRKIGIIGALPAELDLILAQMKDVRRTTVSSVEFCEGTIGEHPVVVARCGVGKVFAAICTQTMILRFAPDIIINTGTAGSLGTLSIGDIAVSADVVQWDMDTSPLGDPVGMLSGLNLVKLPADRALVDTISAALAESSARYCVGTIASGDSFMADPAAKKRIADTFGAVACEMEGAAVGHVCYVNGVPFAVIRAISDGGDESASMDYPTFCVVAAEKSAALVLRVLEKL